MGKERGVKGRGLSSVRLQGRLEPLEVRDVKDAVCHASALGPGLPLRGENQGGGRSLPGRDKFSWC